MLEISKKLVISSNNIKVIFLSVFYKKKNNFAGIFVTGRSEQIKAIDGPFEQNFGNI